MSSPQHVAQHATMDIAARNKLHEVSRHVPAVLSVSLSFSAKLTPEATRMFTHVRPGSIKRNSTTPSVRTLPVEFQLRTLGVELGQSWLECF